MFCSECGAENKLTAKFCVQCGKILSAESVHRSVTPINWVYISYVIGSALTWALLCAILVALVAVLTDGRDILANLYAYVVLAAATGFVIGGVYGQALARKKENHAPR